MTQEAVASFFVHSLYDDVRLECKLYFPLNSSDSGEEPSATAREPILKAAIVAHPYATLGGCLDDHVVQTILSTLQRNGYMVCLFNFRGAGKSGGRTSWTAKPELYDYITVFCFLILFMSELHTSKNEFSNVDEAVQVVLAGYSYGAMIATSLPSPEGIDRYTSSCSPGKMAAITNLARDISIHVTSGFDRSNRMVIETNNQADRLSPTTYGSAGDSEERSSRRLSREFHENIDAAKHNLHNVFSRGARKSHELARPEQTALTKISDLAGPTWSRLKLATLLVSPLLPPVTGFLTAFSKLQIDGSESIGDNKHARLTTLVGQPTLAIHGTGDTFTSTHKFQKWCSERSAQSNTFESKIVDGAGHFWLDEAYESELDNIITRWLQSLSRESANRPT